MEHAVTQYENLMRIPSRAAGAMLAATLLMLAIAVWCGLLIVQQQTLRDTLRLQSEQLRRATAVKRQPQISRSEQEDLRRWNSLRLERSFTWQPLFSALEAASNPDIELLEFRPDKAGCSVILEGEAKDDSSLVAFIEALAAQPVLKNVHLTHKKAKRRDRLSTLSFSIKAAMQLPGPQP